MSSSEREGWQELKTRSRRQCPKLFYQFSTKQESFSLLLTDLIGIWETSLDKYDILAAAARQHTSIDPSVSSKQFGVLLSKIGKSLSNGENSVTRGVERNSHTLLLSTTIALPQPLKALEWTFTLEPQETSELAERILRPSLHEVSVSSNKISSLLSIIAQKDHIISKLLDRVGNSAVDLSLVFPGIAGFARKGGHVSVADAKKHVPGMAAFDEKSWVTAFANEDGYEGADRTGLGNLVRGCEKCFAHSKAEHESWVNHLPTTSKLDEGSNSEQKAKSHANSSVERESDTDDESTDDEFERQPTPPHLKSTSPSAKRTTKAPVAEDKEFEEAHSPLSKQAKQSKIGGLGKRDATRAFGKSQSSTRPIAPAEQSVSPPRRTSIASTATATASEDEMEVDQDSKNPSRKRSKSPRQSAQRPKLGGIGKSRAVARSPSAAPSPSPSPSPAPMPTRSRDTDPSHAPKKDTKDDDETETEDENDDLDASSSSSPVPKPPKPSTPAKTRLLGRLGGKKAPTPARSVTPEPESDEPSAPNDDNFREDMAETPEKRKGRLGRLPKKVPTRVETSSPPPKTKSNQKDSDRDKDDDSDAADSPSPSVSKKRPTPIDKPHSSPAQAPPKKVAPPPAEEETAEEVATRKRMELKRTIEAGPVKKKRRF